MITLSAPSLVPVVELLATRFERVRRPPPPRSRFQAPDEWQAYWAAALADHGLALQPLEPGSELVPVAALTDPHALKVIAFEAGLLRAKLETPEERPLEERLVELAGGFALTDGKVVRWYDSCCARLADLSEWRELLEAPASRFIAHTWVHSEMSGDVVTLYMKHESSKQDADEFQLARSDVAGMLERAEAETQQFRARLGDALRGHVPEAQREAIAKALSCE